MHVCPVRVILVHALHSSVVHTTDAYELLKENLMTRDDAVIGEAAGLAMGLVMIGTKNPTAIDDMINVSALLSVQCILQHRRSSFCLS